MKSSTKQLGEILSKSASSRAELFLFKVEDVYLLFCDMINSFSLKKLQNFN